jgi:hypothetical protein
MNRDAALTYLTEEYRELSGDAKFTSDQITTAYGTAIDMSLRQCGFAESALATADVAQADTLKYLACLNYYALARFAKLLSIRFDVAAGSGAINAQRSQAFKAVSALKEQAATELLQYGINVGGLQSFELGHIQLDTNEPGIPGEFAGFYYPHGF